MDFGLKIGLEGEVEFKKSLREINQAFKVLSSEMNLVTSQFAKNDKSVQALTSRKSVLTKEIDAQKDKISTLESALKNAEESFGANDKRTQAWAIQLNNAKAELNGMERELDENNKALGQAEKGLDAAGKETDEFGKAVDNAGDELDDTGKDTKEFGKEVDSAKEKTSVFGDVLKATLAAEAIKAGLKAMIDGIKAVGSAVKEYVADSMNMATEASMSQTLLTQVMRNMMDATDDQVDSLMDLVSAQEKVGVVSKTAQTTALAELASFVGRKESLEDMLPVMNDYIAYQYGANASSEQARNVATSLGKAIDGNIDGLSKQGFKLTQAEKEWFKTASEMERVEFVTNMVSESMAGVNEALAQTDAGKMERLKTVMDNTKISVGTMANEFKAQILGQMLPSISSLSEAFLGVIRGEGSVEEMAGVFDDVFKQIVVIIEEFLPKLVTIGGNLIEALAKGLSNNMGTIVSGALTLMNQLVKAILELLPIVLEAGTKLLFGLIDGIIRALPALVQAAMQMISALVTGLGEALPNLIPAVVEAIILICQVVTENLPMILDAALEIILGLVDGLLAALPVLIAALPTIISAIIDFIIGSIPKIIDAGIKLLTSLIIALPKIIETIVEAIPKIIDNVISAVIGSIPLIIEAGIKLLVSLIQALPQIITTIVAAIPKIVMGLVDAIIGNIDKIIMAGVQLLVALIANLPTIIVEVIKAVPQIVTGIVQAIISFVPKLAEAGLNLIKGLWQGISDAGAWLWSKISGFFSGIVDGIKGFFGIRSPSALFAGLGENMAQGLGIGFEEQMNQVAKDMQNAIPTRFEADGDVNLFANGESSGRGRGRGGTVVHQTVSITSPKALSEKEAAREFYKLSRKLALST